MPRLPTGINWDDGRLFLAVARAGQLLAAAQALGVNQSTLSRRMTALERSLGTRLLIRRTTGCDLTDAGRTLAAALEPIESAFIAGTAHLGDGESGLSGTIRVGAPDGFGTAFLAPQLADLARLYPALTVELVPVPQSFSLSQREADLAIMIGRPERGRLVARRLTDYSLSLYASREYLDRHQAPSEPSELVDHRLIGYVEDLLYSPALAYADTFWRGWKSQVAISSALGQLQAALSGAGIAILHDYLAREHTSLRPVLPRLRAVRSYWIACHESMRDNARVTAVSRFIAEAVRARQADFLRAP